MYLDRRIHLMDINEFNEVKKRMLTTNERNSNSKNYIDIVLSEIQGRGYNKRPNPRIFLPLAKTAISRAKELDIENQDYPKQLGTHIYKLIEKLITYE